MSNHHHDEEEYAELQAVLPAMYKAARVDFPETADRLGKVATDLFILFPGLDSVASDMGEPTVLKDTVSVMQDVLKAVADSATSLNNAADGIKHVADSYVATDDDARRIYDTMSKATTHFTPRVACVPSDTPFRPTGVDAPPPPTGPVAPPSTDIHHRNGQLGTDLGTVDLPNIYDETQGH